MGAGLLSWILIGCVVGAIMRLVTADRTPGGMIVAVLLGIAGALLAGFLGQVAVGYRPGDPAGWAAAAVGALAVFGGYRLLTARRRG